MLLKRQREDFPGSAVTPRYSDTTALYSNSARDVIYAHGGGGDDFGGLEQGLSAREPMRPRGYRIPDGRSRPYQRDEF